MSVGPIAPPPGGVGGVAGAAGSPQAGAAAASPAAGQTVAAANQAPLQAALSAIITQDIAAQDSLAPLLADLDAALQSGAAPSTAQATMRQILAVQTPIDGTVTGESLRTAVAQSGLFLEAGLAAEAQAPTAAGAAALVGGDLKALLLRLPADLAAQSDMAAQELAPALLGAPDPASRRTSSPSRPPPPVAGGPVNGQRAAPASIGPETGAAELRQALTQEAHAALARLELMQLASTAKPGAPPSWSFELPVVTGQGTGMAQFEVSRDAPQGGGGAGADTEPVWRARFSLNLDEAGPIHAEVALHGTRTRVTLWAEQEGARASLEAGRGDLTAALAGSEGGDAAVRVVAGAPPRPEAPAGRLVDRTS